MATAASLAVVVGADIQGALRGLSAVNRAVTGMGGFFAGAAQQALGFGAALAGMQAASGLGGLVKDALSLNAAYEQTAVGLRTLLGAAAGDKFQLDLRQFARDTPFAYEQLATLSRQLIGTGFDAQTLIPLLRDVGNVSAGMGAGAEGVTRISRALQQMKGIGKVQRGELNQLSEVGINGLDILAKFTGKSVEQINKDLDKGAIGADVFVAAFQQFARQSKFLGAMDAQAKTFAGTWDNVSEAFADFRAYALSPLFDSLKELGQNILAFTRTDAFGLWSERVRQAVSRTMAPLLTFGSTVANISRDHGLSLFDAALVVTEGHIRDTFGPASAAVFNGFQSAARTAFEWLTANGPAAFAWMTPDLIDGFLQHFATFGTTVANISSEHGIGKLQAAFIALETDLARIFGPESAALFNAFGTDITKLAGQIDAAGKQMTGKTLLDFKIIGEGELKLLEKVAGLMNTIGRVNEILRPSSSAQPLADASASAVGALNAGSAAVSGGLNAAAGAPVNYTVNLNNMTINDVAAADRLLAQLAEQEVAALEAAGTAALPGSE